MVPLALLGANSIYLVCIPVQNQNSFYLWMFILHLVLGLGMIFPFLIFAGAHLKKAYRRPNRKAVKAGIALLTTALILILSGLVLMNRRLANPGVYWAHVLSPLAAVALYVVHRLAGPAVRWKWGMVWGGSVAAFVALMALMHHQDPRKWFIKGGGEKYFYPSSARTATGGFIPEQVLTMDAYCKECHQDIYEGWLTSAHRFSSFNNLPYRMTIRDMKKALQERDGNVQATRWCAGCHDTVPFFSGAFDDPAFNDESGSSQAGLTCTSCHAISNINSITGNADYTIEEPLHYPFVFSENKHLKWVNRQLIKAKPAFHKKTFLKPFHRTSEFCSVCHKVALIPEVNKYKWLRGQNHYDSWQLSGVSGLGARSFYYPEKVKKCSDCHMPMTASTDFGNIKGKIHDHFFRAANTGIMAINEQRARDRGDLEMAEKFKASLQKTREFLQNNQVRVDILGLREGGEITGRFLGPIRPDAPELEPGKEYLAEVIVRTLGLGHEFTQGTVDSNEVWVEFTASAGDQLIGHSGLIDSEGAVDEWAQFLNALVLDRHGNRIDRRNAQDIFVALYNHNIPPGAARVTHYRFRVPENTPQPIQFTARVNYRKFDRAYMIFTLGKDKAFNLPVTVMAEDSVTLPVRGAPAPAPNAAHKVPTHLRFNDYGIALMIPRGNRLQRAETRQAEEAFQKVIDLNPEYNDGPINLARVYIVDGKLDEARIVLRKAAEVMEQNARKQEKPQEWWRIYWLGGLVNKQSGFLDLAAGDFEGVLATRNAERGFDFSRDREILNELAHTYFLLSIQDSPESGDYGEKAVRTYQKVLEIDPENLMAHHQLAIVYAWQNRMEESKHHRALHEKYQIDDQAIEQAVTAYQVKNRPAQRFSQIVVIYDLHQRPAPSRTKLSFSNP